MAVLPRIHEGVFYWAYRILGPEFKGPTIEDPLGVLPIPLKTALLQAVGKRFGLEFDLAEALLTRPPNEGRSYAYATHWWPSEEGLKEFLYECISRASLSDWEFVPVETLDDFVRKHRLQGKEHYAEVLFLKEVYLPLFGSEGLALLLPQVGFLDEEGGERRADFILFGQRRYAIEIEGKSYHERPDRFAREKSRQRSLTLRGIAYFPIAYDDIRSGKAREALIRLAESDPVLGGYLRKGGVGLSRGPAYSPLHWLVDFPVRYPIALKGAFARLLKAVREGERSVQIVDPESSTPLVEAAFADAYFTLLNVGRLAGVDLPLPEVRVYRLDVDSVSRAFRDLLPLWVGRVEGFSVVDGVPEEGALDVFSWDRIASLAREADAFQAEYEEERGSWTPPFVGTASSALVLDFFARKFFPVPELKEAQLRLLQRALRGESGLALLPTGYGKSLIFQLYSFLVPGVNIVISPLRALMRDQVYNLQRIGVTAVTSISSDDEAAAKESKTKTLLEGRYRLVYLAPERIRIKGFIEEFRKELGSLPVSAVTVDEAHCVSEWWHDFRPAYLHIRSFYEEIQAASPRKLPLIALTATASPPVRRDILRVLGLPEGAVEQLASSDRPNLSFSVHPAPLGLNQKRNFLRDLLTQVLPRTLGVPQEELIGRPKRSSYPHAGVIFAIYADPRGQKTFEEGVHAIRSFLLKEGLASGDQVHVYASKKPAVCPSCGSSEWFADRGKNTCRSCGSSFVKPKIIFDWEDRVREVQDRFQENRFPLLVATKGYGMGVDKRNIRYIVHHAMSSGLEGYYQEAGRAGRDGRHAHVALILTPPTRSCLEKHVLGGDGIPPCLPNRRFRSCPYGLTLPCDYARQIEFLQGSYPGVEVSLQRAMEVAGKILHDSQEGPDGQRFVEVGGSEAELNSFEYALVRLMQIGFLEAYTVEYLSQRHRRFWFPRPKISRRTFEERLRAFLTETRLGVEAIERRLEPLRRASAGNPLDPVEKALRILLDRVYETVYPMRIQMLRNLIEYALSKERNRCRRLVLRSIFDDQLPPDDYRCGFCDVCEPSLAFSVPGALVPPREAEPEEIVRRLSTFFQDWSEEEADLLLSAASERGLSQAVMLRSEYYLEREGTSLGAFFLAGALKGREDPAQGALYLKRGTSEALKQGLSVDEIGPFLAELGRLGPEHLGSVLLAHPPLGGYRERKQVYEEVGKRLGYDDPAARLAASLASVKLLSELTEWVEQEGVFPQLRSIKERFEASLQG